MSDMLNKSSDLMLVPYLPGSKVHSRTQKQEVTQQADSAENVLRLPRCVIENVIAENYKRRIDEADATPKTFLGEPIDLSDGASVPLHLIGKFTEFRQQDLDPDLTIHQRSGLLVTYVLPSYEIYAGIVDRDAPFLDKTFALECLRGISNGRFSVNDNADAQPPKLTRLIQDNQQELAVVTGKLTAGTYLMQDVITLTSRQAGVLNYSDLPKDEKALIVNLAGYNRQNGRTDELRDMRDQLRELIGKRTVTPLVESLYLARQSAMDNSSLRKAKHV